MTEEKCEMLLKYELQIEIVVNINSGHKSVK
jgi:hypothetical protein